jgi:hypothetical protein
MVGQERRYSCYFCGHEIARQGHDPCEVILVTRVSSPDIEQEDAAVFCHAACIAAAATPGAYFKIPGFPRNQGRSASSTA